MNARIVCVIILIACIGIGCTPKDLPTVLEETELEIIIKISHQTTKVEMENIKLRLKENYNIKFDFRGSSFFEDGRLRDLSLQVVDPIGQKGSTQAMLTNIQFSHYGVRFVRDHDGDQFRLKKIGSI